jgi:hypothetical protein
MGADISLCTEERSRKKIDQVVCPFSFNSQIRRERIRITKLNSTEKEDDDDNLLDLIDIIIQIAMDATDQSKDRPSLHSYLNTVNLINKDFALYQLGRGNRTSQQDDDFVPGRSILDLFNHYFAPQNIFPEDFKLDRFVAKLCWFAGEQRSLKSYANFISATIEQENIEAEEEEEEDEEGEEGEEGEGVEAGGRPSFKEKVDPQLKLNTMNNTSLLFVESLPIKRFLSALVLLCDGNIEKKLFALELLDKPNRMHPQKCKDCPAKKNCIYHQFVAANAVSSTTATRATGATGATPGNNDDGQVICCTCPCIQTLREMEKLFVASWTCGYKIQLGLAADDNYPWSNVHDGDDKDHGDECFHAVMQHHQWQLHNGVCIARSELSDLVHKSNEYKNILNLFGITPHIFDIGGGGGSLPKQLDTIGEEVVIAKDKLRHEMRLQKERQEYATKHNSSNRRKRRGGSADTKLTNVPPKQEGEDTDEKSTIKVFSAALVEAQLRFRKINWSMYQEVAMQKQENAHNKGLIGGVEEEEEEVKSHLLRTHDQWSEWKALLFHGLQTIALECERLYGSTSEEETVIVLSASRNWLNELTFIVEWSHLSLEVATAVLTSPLTLDDMHHQRSACEHFTRERKRTKTKSQVDSDPEMNDSVVATRFIRQETNPWKAIRSNDITSLTILLQHSNFFIDHSGGDHARSDHDPDTGYSPLETAALSGHPHVLYVLIRRIGMVNPVVNHPNLTKCAMRSGSLATLQMCIRYQNELILLHLYRYHHLFYNQEDGPEEQAMQLKQVSVLIFNAYHEKNWRLDMIRYIHHPSSNTSNSSDGTPRRTNNESPLGHSPLPPVTGSLLETLVAKTMTERCAQAVCHAMELCGAKDVEGRMDQRKRTALTLVVLSNNLTLLNAVLFGISGCALQQNKHSFIEKEDIFSKMLQQAIDHKAFDVYVVCRLIVGKNMTMQQQQEGHFIKAEDFMKKKEMVNDLGKNWCQVVLGNVHYNELIEKSQLELFLRSKEHPVPPGEGTKDMRQTWMVERKALIEEYENETANVSAMIQYCEEMTLRCVQYLKYKQARHDRHLKQREEQEKEKEGEKEEIDGKKNGDVGGGTGYKNKANDWGQWWVDE